MTWDQETHAQLFDRCNQYVQSLKARGFTDDECQLSIAAKTLDALAEIERLQERLLVTSTKIAEMTYIINGAQTLEEAWQATDD